MSETGFDERAFLATIAQRLIALDRDGTTDSAAEPVVIDPGCYIDRDRHRSELEQIFAREPQLVCFSSELEGPGAYRCFDELGIPILLLRNAAGELRAYLNACSHRNARLREGCGTVQRITCPYHAWSFDLEGRLQSVYKEETFGPVDYEAHGLTRLPCAERYGMVCVSPDPDGVIDVDAMLGDAAPVFESWQLDRLQPVGSHDFHVRSNWKLALDTFCEGYHFGPLHRESVGDYALGNISAFDTFGAGERNHRLAFPNKTLRDLAGSPTEAWGDANDIFQNFQLVHFIYPNISLLVSPGACEFFRIYPGREPGEHLTRYTCYFRGHMPLETEEQRAAAKAHFEFIVKVVEEEDYWVSANVQRNLNTGLRQRATFGRNEPALINMHRAFAEAVR